jgi:hypothetical protein
MERESKLIKVNNAGEKEGVSTNPRGKKRAFYSLPMKYDR